MLFRQAADEGLLVGISLESMAAACIHAVARKHHQPFPTKEIAAVSPVTHDNIRTAYSKLVQGTDIKIVPPEPEAFVPRFTAAAGLSQVVCQQAQNLAETLIEDGVHIGQSPTGVAAAAIYGAARECGVEVTQEELANVAHVSVVTLSRQWQTVKTYIETPQ
jgi:transcription initiation factor TFIIB